MTVVHGRLLVVIAIALAAAAVGCAYVTEATPTPPIPSDAANQSSVEAGARIKTYWRQNQERFAYEIRSGSRDQAAWDFFNACKQRTPQESWASQCGDYADAKSAAADMAEKAVKLTVEGTWSAVWDGDSRTWTATAKAGAFEWTLRLVEITGEVSVLPNP